MTRQVHHPHPSAPKRALDTQRVVQDCARRKVRRRLARSRDAAQQALKRKFSRLRPADRVWLVVRGGSTEVVLVRDRGLRLVQRAQTITARALPQCRETALGAVYRGFVGVRTILIGGC